MRHYRAPPELAEVPMVENDGSVTLAPLSPPLFEQPLAWVCAFCGMVRIYEGGQPLKFDRAHWCKTCGSLCVMRADQRAVMSLNDLHLL